MKVKGSSANRRYSYRAVLPTVLVAGILLPFLFIRTAFLALDAGASICPSISCLGWRLRPLLFPGSDTSLELVKELRRAYVDGMQGSEPMDPKLVEAAPDSFDDLIAEIATMSTTTTSSFSTYQHLDLKAFVLKTKAMLMKMDRKVQLARLRASVYSHLASIGIPKSIHCFTLRLAEEYLVNALARSSLPPPEYAARLTNTSYVHLALLTDNVLAAAVVVTSAISSCANPESLVFHIVTDKKSYTAMHAWFALNLISPAIVEVKGLHQFDWPPHTNAKIMETVEEIQQGLLAYRHYRGPDEDIRRLEALSPSSFSLLSYLRIHLPELFPKLERVIHLDDDVVVQRDLTQLWDLDLNGNVNGAVVGNGGDNHCLGKQLGDYLNFSNPLVFSLTFALEGDCAWSGGMNVFSLEAWRKTNITQTYQQLLKQNRESGFTMWHLGWLPPALIAFDSHLHSLDQSWHLSGLGRRKPKQKVLESAAVLHFSGPRKPWLEIGFPDLREMWRSYLNRSDEFLRNCRVVE